jgi:acetyl-CoA decarbonylase/synthase complex subunit delta
MICNIGNEVWKCKEAGDLAEDAPTLGDAEKRAILMETVSAVNYLLSGADVVVLRHPESVRMVKSYIELMLNGGAATGVNGIAKRLDLQEVDLLSLSPEPDLNFAGAGEAPAKAAPKEKPKAEKKAEAKPEKKVEKKPKPEAKAKAGTEKKAEAEAKAKAEAEKKAEAEAKAKAEAEKKAEAEAKAKAEAEKKAEAEAKAKAEAEKKAEAEAKAKAEAEKKAEAEAKAREKEELRALRQKRAEEREKLDAERADVKGAAVAKTPASEQKSLVDKLMENLDRIHKRA